MDIHQGSKEHSKDPLIPATISERKRSHSMDPRGTKEEQHSGWLFWFASLFPRTKIRARAI
jgi:hypothetical protein